mmetsp:Transcript_11214/g.43244  ORF Transcript_11214/g.43244 Transcript_11214/m.43244 type:complete len:219 (+) Transcript_11214:1244-1900(+)
MPWESKRRAMARGSTCSHSRCCDTTSDAKPFSSTEATASSAWSKVGRASTPLPTGLAELTALATARMAALSDVPSPKTLAGTAGSSSLQLPARASKSASRAGPSRSAPAAAPSSGAAHGATSRGKSCPPKTAFRTRARATSARRRSQQMADQGTREAPRTRLVLAFATDGSSSARSGVGTAKSLRALVGSAAMRACSSRSSSARAASAAASSASAAPR